MNGATANHARNVAPVVKRAGLTLWLWLGVVAVAIAAGTSYADFLSAIATRESSMNPAAMNPAGYVGLFQVGTMAMQDAGYYRSNGTPSNSWAGSWTGKGGITSLAQFVSNPDLQIQAVSAYYDKLQSYVRSYGLDRYVGHEVGGVPVTLSGLVAGAHLVGIGSLMKFLDSGGSIVPKDGNGVPVTDYMLRFGGYSVGGPVPTFAAVRAASPSGGVAAAPGGSPGGSVGVPGGSPAIPPRFGAMPGGVSSDEAFYAYSGYTMGQVGVLVRNLVGAIAFLWVAWTLLCSWRVFNVGGHTAMEFARENVRSIVLLVVLLALTLS